MLPVSTFVLFYAILIITHHQTKGNYCGQNNVNTVTQSRPVPAQIPEFDLNCVTVVKD
jgi:hypothetical protein